MAIYNPAGLINQTLSHYRIIDQLGAGGMGEVYRAEDTRLGRDVAIKILPESFIEDSERLARFEREARMLAALDHPKIATIFDVDSAEDTHFLVMQLAEGETLAEKIRRGPIPIEESLEIARQIAEALEYAHARNIIHRDLKPANVMVAPGGQVKVLDFGLAKALEHETEGLDGEVLLSASPTLTRDMTRDGVILGTAAYMSPEQAKGEVVDQQADIWAFGCVLYEMLSGHRTNPGNSSAEVIAKILEAEPVWGALPTRTPLAVQRLLRRCLAKDPKHRLQSIGDARIEIEEVGATDGELEAAAGPSASRPRWLELAPWALAAVLALVAASLFFARSSDREIVSVSRFALPGHKLALGDHPVAPVLALSTDGSLMAYIEGNGDSGQLYLRRMDSFESIAVEGASEAQSPFFSPDGKWLGFAAENKLRKVSTEGGRPQDLTSIEVLHGASWADDGTIVYNTAAGLMRIPDTGGQQEVVSEEDPAREEVGHHTPQVLPNGDILFTTVATGARPLEIVQLSTASGTRTTLVNGGSNAVYVPTGHLIWAEEGSLLAAAMNLEEARLESAPVPVAKRIMMGFPSEPGRAHFAVSGNGTLAYVSGPPAATASELILQGRSGEGQRLEGDFESFGDPRLSPTGDRLAVDAQSAGRDNPQIWVLDLRRNTWTLLTRGSKYSGFPLWTLDGSRIVFSAQNEDDELIVSWAPADGSSNPELLLKSDALPTGWTGDGKKLFLQIFKGQTWDVGLFDVDGGTDPVILLGEEYTERQAVLSPGGRWLAYVSDESGRSEIYVRNYPGLNRRWQISNQGGSEPMWSARDDLLFYREGQRIMSVAFEAEPDFSPAVAEVMFDLTRAGSLAMASNFGISYDISPDGENLFYVAEAPPAAEDLELRIVLNWFADLEQLVPTN